ncbi:MAG: hypothetical protein IK021_01830 [Methanobrevibacter sp.]|nr:hypothetical protein [Methanobrevibacter sp.]
MTRTIFQKITSSLWVLVSFVPFFNGLGFVYIGNKYGNAHWFFEGILYQLPLILGILTLPKIEVATVFFMMGTLGKYVSIIRSLMVDYTLQKQLDESEDMEKTISIETLKEYFEGTIDSLWVLISFIPFFNGMGLVYKGKASLKKSWVREGILYEIPWALGVLSLAIEPLRYVAFKLAMIFYFVSIIRSIMVASEPKPIYNNRDLLSEDVEFNIKSEEESFVNKIKIKEEKQSRVKTDEGVIPAFQFYRKQFKELEEIYPQKEKNALELIEKRFAPPQLTYTRFKGVVDDSHETFYSQLNAGYNILELSTEYSTKVEDELKNKVIILNYIIKSLDSLSEELVLNINQVETESEDEINQLFEEFTRATSSVKHY